MEMHLGLGEDNRKKIAAGLSRFLADSYILYLKTHNYHWNVTGPMFNTLHIMFEEQYTEQWQALDEIAERIRALGEPAPGTFSKYIELSSIKEPQGVPAAMDMVKDLVEAQEAVVRSAREIVPVAEEAGDEVTVDLLIGRMQVHEKTAWMLRSLLEK